jgi:hypothetical protein
VSSRTRQLVLKANAAFLGLFGADSFFVLDVTPQYALGRTVRQRSARHAAL